MAFVVPYLGWCCSCRCLFLRFCGFSLDDSLINTMKSHHDYAETMGVLHNQMYLSHIRFQQSYDSLLHREEESKQLPKSREVEIQCLKKNLQKAEDRLEDLQKVEDRLEDLKVEKTSLGMQVRDLEEKLNHAEGQLSAERKLCSNTT